MNATGFTAVMVVVLWLAGIYFLTNSFWLVLPAEPSVFHQRYILVSKVGGLILIGLAEILRVVAAGRNDRKGERAKRGQGGSENEKSAWAKAHPTN